MRKLYIYKIFIPNTGKSYIGETFDVENRIKKHFKVAKEGYVSEFYNDLLKYKDYIQVEILEETTNDKRYDREEYWIKYYDTFNNGYNRTFRDGYNRLNTTNGEKQRKAATEYANSKYNAWKTLVHQLDENNIIIKTFDSVTEVSKYLNVNRRFVTKILNEKIPIDNKYYIRGEKPKKEKVIKEKSKYSGIKVELVNEKDEIIKSFDSIIHAMDVLKMTRQQIMSAIENKTLIENKYYLKK